MLTPDNLKDFHKILKKFKFKSDLYTACLFISKIVMCKIVKGKYYEYTTSLL